jgi:hypothetical protein
VKEHITPHADWCPAKDNSQVLWDPEDGISLCHACLAVTEERDTDTEVQIPEEPDGHET